MNRCRLLFVALAVGCLTLTASRPAAAQATRPLQLGLGYQFVHRSFDGSGDTFPGGIYADLSRAVISDERKAWGWMGQFEAGVRRSDGYTEGLYTLLGGVRLASARPLRWVPSGHGLIGIARLTSSCDILCFGDSPVRDARPADGSRSLTSPSGLALQAGIALSTRLTGRVAVSAGFRATKLKVSGRGLFNTAVSGGLRVDLGRAA